MKLNYHPDGIVFIKDDNEIVLYMATADNFAIDYGSAFPKSAPEIRVADDLMTRYDAKDNQIDSGETPKELQSIMDSLDALNIARAQREKPPVTIPISNKKTLGERILEMLVAENIITQDKADAVLSKK